MFWGIILQHNDVYVCLNVCVDGTYSGALDVIDGKVGKGHVGEQVCLGAAGVTLNDASHEHVLVIRNQVPQLGLGPQEAGTVGGAEGIDEDDAAGRVTEGEVGHHVYCFLLAEETVSVHSACNLVQTLPLRGTGWQVQQRF